MMATVKQALLDALDSLTIVELTDVFGRDYKSALSKSYSEQIADIIAPKLAAALVTRSSPVSEVVSEIRDFLQDIVGGAKITERSIETAKEFVAAIDAGEFAQTPAETTAVERFQKRIVEMMQAGCTGFHFTSGPRWHSMDIEEKCAAMLEVWDAERTPVPPARSLTKEESDLMWKAVFESGEVVETLSDTSTLGNSK